MPLPSSPATPLVVAVPVYGARILPRFGVAREFVVAELELGAHRVQSLQSHLWDPASHPRLGRWLRDLGAVGVICGGIHPRFVTALEADGLWVQWGQRGPVEEVLRQWALAGFSVHGEPRCRPLPVRCSAPGEARSRRGDLLRTGGTR